MRRVLFSRRRRWSANGAVAGVDFRLADPAPQRRLRQVPVLGDLAGAADVTVELDRLRLLLAGELPSLVMTWWLLEAVSPLGAVHQNGGS